MSKTATAVKAAASSADPKWMAAADRAVRRLAKREATFTTDEVWQALKRSKATTSERRAMGAVMRKAAADGVIRSTQTYRVSTRPECHRRPVTIWESVRP